MVSESATSGGLDFNIASSQLNISSFSNSGTIYIPIIDDELLEGPETFTVVLTSANYATFPCDTNHQYYDPTSSYCSYRLQSLSVKVTIIDNETIPEISIDNMRTRIGESAGTLTISVDLRNASTQPISLNYSTSDKSATGGATSGNGIDYETQTNQILSFEIGETSAEATIPIYPDSLNEGDETFNLTFSDATGAVFPDFASSLVQTITIEDDESPTLSVVDSTLSSSERAGVTAIELMLNGPTSDLVEVTYSTSIESTDTAVQADFITQPHNTLSILPTETSGIIAIPITNDTIDENNETFTLTLSEISGAVFAGGTSIVKKVTIVDDYGLPTLTANSTSMEISEGGGSVNLGLTLSAAPNPSQNVSLKYSTTSVTASNDGIDYEIQSDTLFMISSGTTGTISIPIMDDTEIESNEKFTSDSF